MNDGSLKRLLIEKKTKQFLCRRPLILYGSYSTAPLIQQLLIREWNYGNILFLLKLLQTHLQFIQVSQSSEVFFFKWPTSVNPFRHQTIYMRDLQWRILQKIFAEYTHVHSYRYSEAVKPSRSFIIFQHFTIT